MCFAAHKPLVGLQADTWTKEKRLPVSENSLLLFDTAYRAPLAELDAPVRQPPGGESTGRLAMCYPGRRHSAATTAPTATMDSPGRMWNCRMCAGSYMQASCMNSAGIMPAASASDMTVRA